MLPSGATMDLRVFKMLKFIDISGNNKNFELSYLVGQIDAVMIKATEGTGFVSSVCDKNFQAAKRYRLARSFYHYARNNDATVEADFFYRNCKNYFGEGIPCLDWEEGQSAAWVNAFVRRVHELSGIWPWIYASKATFNENPGVEPNCGRWVAQWPGSSADTFGEAESKPKPKLAEGLVCAWQFTSKGKLTGYSGNLDMNLFYGDREAWCKYANPDAHSGDAGGSAGGPDGDVPGQTVLENDDYKVTIERK